MKVFGCLCWCWCSCYDGVGFGVVGGDVGAGRVSIEY
jgi:hypothetical protein